MRRIMPVVQHAPHARHHLFGGNAHLPGNRMIGLRLKRQAGLGGKNDLPVYPIIKLGISGSGFMP